MEEMKSEDMDMIGWTLIDTDEMMIEGTSVAEMRVDVIEKIVIEVKIDTGM